MKHPAKALECSLLSLNYPVGARTVGEVAKRMFAEETDVREANPPTRILATTPGFPPPFWPRTLELSKNRDVQGTRLILRSLACRNRVE